jgi:hypothetical protein
MGSYLSPGPSTSFRYFSTSSGVTPSGLDFCAKLLPYTAFTRSRCFHLFFSRHRFARAAALARSSSSVFFLAITLLKGFKAFLLDRGQYHVIKYGMQHEFETQHLSGWHMVSRPPLSCQWGGL